jgi:predicted RNA-binding protein (virulence factor B family)
MQLGEYNDLTILRFTSIGAYLGDEEDNDVLLPGKFINEEWKEGDTVHVYLYRDSEDRLIATTLHPLLTLGKFAYLKVNQVNFFGAFLEWGIEKDLMVPFKEQKKKLEEGQYALVYLYIDDKTDRLLASAKIGKFLEETPADFALNEPIAALISDKMDNGIRVIVDNKYAGIIYDSDITRELKRGSVETVYPFKIREDGRMDVRLEPEGYEKILSFTDQILDSIKRHNGLLPLNDYSHPDDIREILGMSKKNFKKTVGALYKNREITISEEGIRIASEA